VAINLLALFYMVPLGFSLAAVTRVGNLIGEKRHHRAQVASWCAFGLAGAAAGVSAVLFVLLRDLLPRVYTADDAVVAVAASVLPVAAAFQVFDALQAVGGGVLRGMGRTRPAAVIHFVGFYTLALPLGWFLAFRRGMGLPGVWWGLALGLAIAGLLLVAWIRWRGPASLAREA
jgi:MATE family multidrug resistance protein